jgi:hypothetical protein
LAPDIDGWQELHVMSLKAAGHAHIVLLLNQDRDEALTCDGTTALKWMKTIGSNDELEIVRQAADESDASALPRVVDFPAEAQWTVQRSALNDDLFQLVSVVKNEADAVHNVLHIAQDDVVGVVPLSRLQRSHGAAMVAEMSRTLLRQPIATIGSASIATPPHGAIVRVATTSKATEGEEFDLRTVGSSGVSFVRDLVATARTVSTAVGGDGPCGPSQFAPTVTATETGPSLFVARWCSGGELALPSLSHMSRTALSANDDGTMAVMQPFAHNGGQPAATWRVWPCATGDEHAVLLENGNARTAAHVLTVDTGDDIGDEMGRPDQPRDTETRDARLCVIDSDRQQRMEVVVVAYDVFDLLEARKVRVGWGNNDGELSLHRCPFVPGAAWLYDDATGALTLHDAQEPLVALEPPLGGAEDDAPERCVTIEPLSMSRRQLWIVVALGNGGGGGDDSRDAVVVIEPFDERGMCVARSAVDSPRMSPTASDELPKEGTAVAFSLAAMPDAPSLAHCFRATAPAGMDTSQSFAMSQSVVSGA